MKITNLLRVRISRRQYWLMVGLHLAALYGAPALTGQELPGGGSTVLWLFIYGGRLHDIGRSAWWGAAAMVVSLVPLGLGMMFGGPGFWSAVADPEAEGTDQALLWSMIAIFGSTGLEHLFTLVLGIPKGDPGENRFALPPAGWRFGAPAPIEEPGPVPEE